MISSNPRGILLRHWRAVTAGIVLTVGLVVAAFVVVPVTYEAKALIVLLPPKTTVGTGGNPYTELGGLDTVAGVLSLAMNTEAVALEVARTSPSAGFEVTEDESTSGPVLLLTVDDDDPTVALDALDALIAQADPTLSDLQSAAGAPRDTLISTALVTRDDKAAVVRQSQIRVLLAVGAVGMALTGLLVAVLDRRSRGKRASAVEADPPTTAAPVVPPLGPPAPRPTPDAGRPQLVPSAVSATTPIRLGSNGAVHLAPSPHPARPSPRKRVEAVNGEPQHGRPVGPS